MLVLNRKKNEKIMIGEDIVVTVLSTGGSNARIGIEAPDGVAILREEIINQQTKPLMIPEVSN